MELSNLNIKNGLCISLGANIDSKFGRPSDTLINSRPIVEDIIKNWIKKFFIVQNKFNTTETKFCWSSLYLSNPHGISEPQPDYINTLLLVKSNYLQQPCPKKTKYLLFKFKILESEYGRKIYEDNKKWQSRCLDLDILWWENLNYQDNELTLPHPRFLNRNFVITPLAEVLNRSQKIDKLIDKRWQI